MDRTAGAAPRNFRARSTPALISALLVPLASPHRRARRLPLAAAPAAGAGVAALGFALAVAACGDASSGATTGAASGARVVVSSDEPRIPGLGSTPDIRAAKEILGKVPTAVAAPSATLVGTDTGEELPDGGTTTIEKHGEEDHGAARVTSVQTNARAANSVERLLRATVYFDIVDRCRDADGHVLPPESVRLSFVIGSDGLIVPTMVKANPKSPKYADAAQCMVRELLASNFRAPPPGKVGVPTNVTTDVPCVD